VQKSNQDKPKPYPDFDQGSDSEAQLLNRGYPKSKPKPKVTHPWMDYNRHSGDGEEGGACKRCACKKLCVCASVYARGPLCDVCSV